MLRSLTCVCCKTFDCSLFRRLRIVSTILAVVCVKKASCLTSSSERFMSPASVPVYKSTNINYSTMKGANWTWSTRRFECKTRVAHTLKDGIVTCVKLFLSNERISFLSVLSNSCNKPSASLSCGAEMSHVLWSEGIAKAQEAERRRRRQRQVSAQSKDSEFLVFLHSCQQTEYKINFRRRRREYE